MKPAFVATIEMKNHSTRKGRVKMKKFLIFIGVLFLLYGLFTATVLFFTLG